jgi:hypothetical protein
MQVRLFENTIIGVEWKVVFEMGCDGALSSGVFDFFSVLLILVWKKVCSGMWRRESNQFVSDVKFDFVWSCRAVWSEKEQTRSVIPVHGCFSLTSKTWARIESRPLNCLTLTEWHTNTQSKKEFPECKAHSGSKVWSSFLAQVKCSFLWNFLLPDSKMLQDIYRDVAEHQFLRVAWFPWSLLSRSVESPR